MPCRYCDWRSAEEKANQWFSWYICDQCHAELVATGDEPAILRKMPAGRTGGMDAHDCQDAFHASCDSQEAFVHCSHSLCCQDGPFPHPSKELTYSQLMSARAWSHARDARQKAAREALQDDSHESTHQLALPVPFAPSPGADSEAKADGSAEVHPAGLAATSKGERPPSTE